MRSLDYTINYPAARPSLLAENIVSTSQPLAAQAGLDILRKGGNAVDAALAAAITAVVVEPTGCGLGGDAFAIIWDGNNLSSINGSGPSPEAWTPQLFSSFEKMPNRGWLSVTIPGMVKTWAEIHKKHGSLCFEELFEKAIDYAENGFIVSPVLATLWASIYKKYADQPGFNETYLPNGQPPAAGDLFKNPPLATSLRSIAKTYGESFYTGELAKKLVDHSTKHGGVLQAKDLENYEPLWTKTIRKDFFGYEIHEIPPNTQGIATLIALGILEKININDYEMDSVESIHLQIEAVKLAFSDTYAHITDADHMSFDYEELLDDKYLSERSQLIDINNAQEYETGMPKHGGTVYICAADKNGMMISFVQSNYEGFGSGVVVDDTGISLQNRGMGFSLNKDHPNYISSSKKTFHTIIPGFVMKDGKPLTAFGLMGGPMQAQGHLQLLIRMYLFNLTPQAASDAPRWQVKDGLNVIVEPSMPIEIIEGLRKLGHKLLVSEINDSFSFGGAQIIEKTKNGYIAGSDFRKDGMAVGF